MALPIIAVSLLLGGSLLHANTKNHYKQIEKDRRYRSVLDIDNQKVIKTPSSYYDHGNAVTPLFGSVVCCEIYNVLDHSGIWIDQDTIIELSDSGLVRAVGVERFLKNRSGQHIFIATDHSGKPLQFKEAAEKAIAALFTYRQYNVIDNNCHQFVFECLEQKQGQLTRFTSLGEEMAKLKNTNIFWDIAKTKSYTSYVSD